MPSEPFLLGVGVVINLLKEGPSATPPGLAHGALGLVAFQTQTQNRSVLATIHPELAGRSSQGRTPTCPGEVVPGTSGTKWQFYCGNKQKTAGLS